MNHCPDGLAADYADNSQCQAAPPPEWTCNPIFYGRTDGCDCGCAVLDPDCEGTGFGACQYHFCVEGDDEDPSGTDPTDPTQCLGPGVPGWTCNDDYFGDGDCDCGCHYPDPDCPAPAKLQDCLYQGCEPDMYMDLSYVDPDDVLLCLAEDPFFAAGWTARWPLDLDVSGLSEPVLDVPVAVRLDPGLVAGFDAVRPAVDLRFVQDGAELPFEVEVATPTRLLVWVRLAHADPGVTQRFFMYGDNPALDTSYDSSPAQVWSHGYEAVWHFNDLADSVHTNPELAIDFAGAGALTGDLGLGPAVELDNTGGGNITYTDGSALDLLVGTAHPGVVALAATTPDGGHQKIIDVAHGANSLDSRLSLLINNADQAVCYLRDAAYNSDALFSNGTVADGTPRVFAAYSDLTADTSWLYVDGALATDPLDSVLTAGTTSTQPPWGAAIGSEEDLTTATFNGVIDEVRLSHVARSASWVWLEARTLRGAAVVVGAVVNAP